MRLKNYLLYFCLLLSVNLLVSCDDDDDDAEPSKTELLTSGEWRGDRVLLNNINVASIPGIGSNATTFQTLRMNFMRDNTYTIDFEAQGQPQTLEGTWQFNEDETVIALEAIGELQIETLTEDNLDLSTTISSDNIVMIGQILGIDTRLIEVFSGGNPVNAEMRFVK